MRARTKSDTHLGDNLELLALAELRLGDSLLKTRDGLGVEFLFSQLAIIHPNYPQSPSRSRGERGRKNQPEQK